MKVDEKILKQIEEDRKRNQELYDSLKNQVVTIQEFTMVGDVLVKISDLMNKQTAQLIEMHKVESRNKPVESGDFSLTKDEAESLQDEIEESVGSLRSVK
jgi:hypothetical protein